MKRRIRMVFVIVAGVVVVLVFVLFVASAAGSNRFRAGYENEKADLLRRGRAAPSPAVDAASTAHLPPPGRREVGDRR